MILRLAIELLSDRWLEFAAASTTRHVSVANRHLISEIRALLILAFGRRESIYQYYFLKAPQALQIWLIMKSILRKPRLRYFRGAAIICRLARRRYNRRALMSWRQIGNIKSYAPSLCRIAVKRQINSGLLIATAGKMVKAFHNR